MTGGKGKGSRGDENSLDAGQQDIGAIGIGREAEFTTQTPQPEDRVWGPRLIDMIDKQSRE